MKNASPLILSLLTLVACTDESDDVLRSELARDRAPAVTAEQLTSLVRGNTDFAFDLFRALPRKSNVIFSPHNISIALAMLAAGARDETLAQIDKTLHFDRPPAELHPAMNALDLAISSPENPAPDAMVLRNAGALWMPRSATPAPEVLDTLALHYGTGLQVTDFAKDPAAAAARINGWASEQTRGRIPALIEDLSPDTAMVLTSATYFAAKWRAPFPADKTELADFRVADDSIVRVEMMSSSQIDGFRQAVVDDVQLVELPYKEHDAVMLLAMPRVGSPRLESKLSSAQLDKWLGALGAPLVRVSMPKWKATSDFPLAELLPALGMPRVFQTGLELDGFSAGGLPAVTSVIHKAEIEVDENGTVASAATAVGSNPNVPPPIPNIVTFDRPFYFFILHRETRALLFAGLCGDPRPAR